MSPTTTSRRVPGPATSRTATALFAVSFAAFAGLPVSAAATERARSTTQGVTVSWPSARSSFAVEPGSTLSVTVHRHERRSRQPAVRVRIERLDRASRGKEDAVPGRYRVVPNAWAYFPAGHRPAVAITLPPSEFDVTAG